MNINIDLSKRLEELQSLNQDNVSSWPLWVYISAVTLVAIVILVAGNWYFVQPKQDTLAQAQHKEQTLRKELERKHNKVANLDAYRKQLAKMRKVFADQLRQLPNKTEVPKLLTDISRARAASGLQEKLFRPKAEVKKDFYAVIPNDLVVVGTYQELASFASRVASLPRIVTLDDVTIKPAGSADKLRMSVTAKTFRYLDDKGS